MGSVIADFLALVAAAAAYVAGVLQAKATCEAAKQQIAAIERQRNEVCEHIKKAQNISREQTWLITKILKSAMVYPATADSFCSRP